MDYIDFKLVEDTKYQKVYRGIIKTKDQFIIDILEDDIVDDDIIYYINVESFGFTAFWVYSYDDNVNVDVIQYENKHPFLVHFDYLDIINKARQELEVKT